MKTTITGRRYGYIDSRLSFPAVLLILGFSVSGGLSAVKPNSLFTDHMVLQQGMPVPVWGGASAGEKITVELGDRAKAETVAGSDGRWMVVMPPLKVSCEPAELVICGENEIRIRDVLVGEVWIGSGQSNMQMPVRETLDASVAQDASSGRFSRLRFFRVPWTSADEPLPDTQSSWQTATPGTVADFSAVLFFFGRALREAMPDTPIGLINASVGATNAHAWIPQSVFEKAPELEPLRQWYRGQLELLPQKDPAYDRELKAYEAQETTLKQAGQPPARVPEPPMGPRSKRRPASLYNGMVAPLVPYAIQGVLWYQGENNASVEWTGYYADLMTSLIVGWRADWARAAGATEKRNFPFYIAQLPNFPNTNDWPLVREQQLKVIGQTPGTDLVVLIDCGDPNTIHPANKTPVGQRLALLARTHTYGEKLIANGPMMKSVAFMEGKAVVEFECEDLRRRDGQPLRHFEIAGSDRLFHPAQAEIKGRTIVVRSPDVSKPVAVRYAWSNDPENINLINSVGLPASPFRSDDFSPP